MDISLAIGFLCLGACIGGLIVIGWLSPDRPLRDQFSEMHLSDESIEQRSRRVL
jgi:hypothetical protein